MRRTFGIAAAGLPLLFAAALYYFLQLALAEDLYVSEWSIAAYMLIREDLVRDFPRIEPVDTPRYYYSVGDGPKLPANGISYQSSADRDSLLRAAEAYLRDRGFTPDPSDDARYQTADQTVTLRVARQGDASHVALTAYQ